MIVAVARNGTIGFEDRLPWRLRADLMRFKRLTMGHAILMGRRTYESIGRLLPGRTTIILTRQEGYQVSGAIVVHSVEEALGNVRQDQDLYVVGGAEVYRLCMDKVAEIHVTHVLADIQGDTSLEPIDWSAFSLVELESLPSDLENDWPTRYERWKRR